MFENYSFPFNGQELMKKKSNHPKCSLANSVRQHLFLILITRFGDCRFDEKYGCEIWEHDFENLKVLDQKRHQVEHSIKELLQTREPRLSDVTISVTISQEEIVSNRFKKIKHIKKKIQIVVKGRLTQTNKGFNPPPYIIYFSPVTTEGI